MGVRPPQGPRLFMAHHGLGVTGGERGTEGRPPVARSSPRSLPCQRERCRDLPAGSERRTDSTQRPAGGAEFLSAQGPGEAASDLPMPIFASFPGNPKHRCHLYLYVALTVLGRTFHSCLVL